MNHSAWVEFEAQATELEDWRLEQRNSSTQTAIGAASGLQVPPRPVRADARRVICPARYGNGSIASGSPFAGASLPKQSKVWHAPSNRAAPYSGPVYLHAPKNSAPLARPKFVGISSRSLQIVRSSAPSGSVHSAPLRVPPVPPRPKSLSAPSLPLHTAGAKAVHGVSCKIPSTKAAIGLAFA